MVVTASSDHDVRDRRRIQLVEPGITPAPFHYDSARLTDDETAELVATVRASAVRAGGAALDALAASTGPITSVSLRTWPSDFPTEVAILRRAPYESRADPVMYRQVLADLAGERGWTVHLFDARDVVGQASAILGDRATAVLDGPRARLGPPWTKDHRTALAAAVVAAADP